MLHGKYQITDEEKAKRDYTNRNAIANVELSGFMIDKRIKAIRSKWVNGDLSLEEVKKKEDAVIAKIVAEHGFK
jgi:hypothetical protein